MTLGESSLTVGFPLISGDKQLDGYQKKKYVCKLLFIFLLGHDIDFGHMEAVNLLSSNKYTEKQIVSCRKTFFETFHLNYIYDESLKCPTEQIRHFIFSKLGNNRD